MQDVFQRFRSLKQICLIPEEIRDDPWIFSLLTEAKKCGIAILSLSKSQDYSTVIAQSGISADSCLLLTNSVDTFLAAGDLPLAIIGFGDLFLADLSHYGRQPEILVESFEEIDVQFLDRIMKRAQHLPWITVVTDRCVLREITLDDMDDLFELYAGEGITDYIEDLYERPEEEAYTRAYIENMYRFYGYGMWLVTDRKTGKLIGRAGFSHQDLGDEIVLEMGYLIGKPYQQQGYATEVCQKLITFAQENLDFSCINCFVDPDNAISSHLLEKLAFTKQKACTIIDGHAMLRYIYPL